jgi:AbrB family looped-hinge helix DNA binding protein
MIAARFAAAAYTPCAAPAGGSPPERTSERADQRNVIAADPEAVDPPTPVLARWRKPCHFYTMKSTIDSAGRVVIPKALRTRLGLRGGEAIEIQERDGTIVIEPAPTPMSLVDEGDRGLAAVPNQELPPLTDDLVRATLEGTRR